MKIILSRKGFDSGTGGVPSPIFPDGTMVSLPIPGGAIKRYDQVQTIQGSLGTLVRSLTKGAMKGQERAHLDPDLWEGAFPRKPGWKGSLGQVGVAQSHLQGQGVGVGDVFLFFGWFRAVKADEQGAWRFVPKAPERHVLFGYLQIGEIVTLGARPDTAALLAQRPWLEGHPHVQHERASNNTLYVAADRLTLEGRDMGMPGAGMLGPVRPELVLTAPGRSKSCWALPEWMGVEPGQTPLTYHGSQERWGRTDDGRSMLQSVAKGQEFVCDVTHYMNQAKAWLTQVLQPENPSVRPTRQRHRP